MRYFRSKLREIVERVLGVFRLGNGLFAKPRARRDQASDHAEVLLDVAGDPQLAARLQAFARYRDTSSAVKTRRFLCRFFHHGSGK